MADHYDDEHHTEIHEGDTPEEYADHIDDGAEADAQARADAKAKKDKKIQFAAFGTLGLAALGFFGYKAFGGSGQPKTVSAPMVAQQNAPMAAPLPSPSAMPAAAPALPSIPGQPASAIPAGGAAMGAMPSAALGMGGLPAAGQGVAANQQSAGMNMGQGQPGGLGMPSGSVANNVPQNPRLGLPDATGLAAGSEVQKPAPDGLARGLDELAKKIDDLKSMFNKFDEMNIGDRLAKLESRVEALEGGKDTVKKSGEKLTSQSNGAHHVKHRHHAPRSSTPRVVPLGQDEDLLFARISDARQNSISPADVRSPSQRSSPVQESRSYSLHAVIPNRIWIKGQDGASQTFERGETLPDGSKILKIDPDRGDVVTSNGVLRFEGR